MVTVYFYGHEGAAQRLEEEEAEKRSVKARKERVRYLGDEARSVVDEALADAAATAEEREALQCYTANSLDPVGMGSVAANTGARLGLPLSFDWADPAAAAGQLGRVVHATVPSWGLDGWRVFEGEEEGSDGPPPAEDPELAASLVLSRPARKFAVALELEKARGRRVVSQAMAPVALWAVGVAVAAGLDEHFIKTMGRRFGPGQPPSPR